MLWNFFNFSNSLFVYCHLYEEGFISMIFDWFGGNYCRQFFFIINGDSFVRGRSSLDSIMNKCFFMIWIGFIVGFFWASFFQKSRKWVWLTMLSSCQRAPLGDIPRGKSICLGISGYIVRILMLIIVILCSWVSIHKISTQPGTGRGMDLSLAW